MFPTSRLTFLLLIAVLTVTSASAQGPATGTPPFGSYGGGPDIINLGNLNAHLDIPVFARAGRGGFNFTYDLSYDSSVWYPVGASGNQAWQPVANWGWRGQTEVAVGYVSYATTTGPWCYYFGNYYGNGTTYSNWVYHDSFGVPHPFGGSTYVRNSPPGMCDTTESSMTVTTWDGSGWTISATGSALNGITSSSGEVIHPPVNNSAGAATATDRNGNQISVNGSGVFTDTLGTTALTVSGSGNPSSPLVFTYTPPSGGSAAYTVRYTTYSIQTNFGCSSITDYGTNGTTTANLVSEIDLPDGSKYTFVYEPTYNHSGFYTGRLSSVTLPTGGTITYQYSTGTSGINGISCSDGSATTLVRTTPDTGSSSWTYARTGTLPSTTTTITDPQNNQTVIQFQQDNSGTNNFYETQRQIYQGSSTLLLTTATCYNGASSPCTGTAITLQITQRDIYTYWPAGFGSTLQSKHTEKYTTTYGLTNEIDDYDYGSGTLGPLLRQTLITYANLGSYLNAFTQTVTVKDGSGTIKYRQDTNYDQYSGFTGANCITGAPNHDDTGHGCSFTARANATSTTTYTNPSAPSGGITQNLTYDSLGNLRTIQDALNNTTTLAYSPDSWANSYCNPSSTSYAYRVSVTNALNQTTSFKYYACAGLVGSATDPNNQTTNVSYDSLLRPTQETFPDGGQTTVTYNSQTSIQTQAKMDTTPHYITRTLLLDGLGRTRQTQINSDPQGVDYTDTAYDALGRVASISNPYRSTNDPTYGITSYVYDPLNRICAVVPPDGTAVSGSTCPSTQPTNDIVVTYHTNNTTTTDQATKTRRSFLDGLGRISQITEDPGGLGYVTAYTYDVFGNIINVTQNGGRQRTFTYDALSRLVCESNPEIQIATCPNPDNGSYTAGTIRYSYDNNSNLVTRQAPAPNQTGSATVTTTYQYDALNRLKQKSYNDGTTPTAFFAYEQTSAWGTTLTNPVGRLTEEWTGTSCCATGGAEIFGYDPMGRIIVNEQYTTTMSYRPMNYTYDLAGNMLTYTDGVGETYTQTFDTAGRGTQLNSSWVDSQHPATMLSGITYNPANAMTKLIYGNGLTGTTAFNKTLQPCRINLNSSATALNTCADAIPSGNWQDFNYGFNSGSSNNGNVASWTATGQQAFSRSFSYDSVNRLATMQETNGSSEGCKPSSSPTNPYTLSWGYDAWGNRTSQSPSSGTCSFSQSVNTQNQLVGPPYQYDAAGNMTNDGNHTYFYDAENRLIQVDGTLGTCSTATACYLYDALGRRTTKSVGTAQTNYIYALNGNVISEADQNGTWMNVYLRMNGQFIAQYLIGSPRTQFILSDHLGSARVLTKYDGTFVDSLDFLPFGEQIGGTSSTTHRFTDDERDSETGLDHTWFRQYSSSLGRWMHEDPAGLAAVDPTNPQSWNRYAYVMNNPLNLVDPFGLTSGNDCDGGPCYDGWYIGDDGCAYNVTYSQQSSGGSTYDVPKVTQGACGFSQFPGFPPSTMFPGNPPTLGGGATPNGPNMPYNPNLSDKQILAGCKAVAKAAAAAQPSAAPNASSIISTMLGAAFGYVFGKTPADIGIGAATGTSSRSVGNFGLQAYAFNSAYQGCTASHGISLPSLASSGMF